METGCGWSGTPCGVAIILQSSADQSLFSAFRMHLFFIAPRDILSDTNRAIGFCTMSWLSADPFAVYSMPKRNRGMWKWARRATDGESCNPCTWYTGALFYLVLQNVIFSKNKTKFTMKSCCMPQCRRLSSIQQNAFFLVGPNDSLVFFGAFFFYVFFLSQLRDYCYFLAPIDLSDRWANWLYGSVSLWVLVL